MFKAGWVVAAIAAMTLGCIPAFPDGDGTPMVNLQITEYKDFEAFQRITAELETRDIKATIMLSGEFAAEHCERIRELHEAGHEIMLFIRPAPLGGQSRTLSDLSYEEQQELITNGKAALENCLGTQITGFRCTQFDQNEDTYQILDSLGFTYNLGFVANSYASFPGHEAETLPYRSEDYDFWAVPMHSKVYLGRLVAFCDNPFRGVTAATWQQLLLDELDAMTVAGRPLLVEFHPYNITDDEARFEAFVAFLNYAVDKQAQFLSVADLVTRASAQ